MENELHIYLRVSSHTQLSDGFGIETQRDSGETLSKGLRLKPIIWNEGDASSSKDDLDNRPVIVELLDAIDRGEVKHLYVFNTDRLSRNQQTWGYKISYWES
jgi:DNA invertase Pin-like site-specific DNA recombinase